MSIQALLIDADGVIQRQNTPAWPHTFRYILPWDDQDRVAKCAAEIYAAETAALVHGGGFRRELTTLLAKWDVAHLCDEVVGAMCSIDLYEENIKVIQAVRHKGIDCYLATNQEVGRARHMQSKFNYAALFDATFYSCFLGAAKPHATFFERALAGAGCAAAEVLFIDDRAENVEGARRAGLHAEVYDGTEGPDALKALLAKFGL